MATQTQTMPLAPSTTPPPTYNDSPFDHDEHEYHNDNNNTHTQRPSMTSRLHRLSSRGGRAVLNRAATLREKTNPSETLSPSASGGITASSMEKECLKAARTLYTFTKLPEESRPFSPNISKRRSRKSLVKIPAPVLANCAGLAIFNVLRAGAWHGSLSGGSGVVVSRRPDGSWSPPSAFIVTSLGAGFVLGLDVYDCVCVLNTPEQVAAFTNPRLSLGGSLSVAVGPVGGGSAVNAAVSKTARPMWTYMKSRGLWAGLQVDGTVIVSRGDANAKFYGEKGISARRILTDPTVNWPVGSQPLYQILRAIDGNGGIDAPIVEQVADYPPPGDEDAREILEDKQRFAALASETPEYQQQNQHQHSGYEHYQQDYKGNPEVEVRGPEQEMSEKDNHLYVASPTSPNPAMFETEKKQFNDEKK